MPPLLLLILGCIAIGVLVLGAIVALALWLEGIDSDPDNELPVVKSSYVLAQGASPTARELAKESKAIDRRSQAVEPHRYRKRFSAMRRLLAKYRRFCDHEITHGARLVFAVVVYAVLLGWVIWAAGHGN